MDLSQLPNSTRFLLFAPIFGATLYFVVMFFIQAIVRAQDKQQLRTLWRRMTLLIGGGVYIAAFINIGISTLDTGVAAVNRLQNLPPATSETQANGQEGENVEGFCRQFAWDEKALLGATSNNDPAVLRLAALMNDGFPGWTFQLGKTINGRRELALYPEPKPDPNQPYPLEYALVQKFSSHWIIGLGSQDDYIMALSHQMSDKLLFDTPPTYYWDGRELTQPLQRSQPFLYPR